MTPTLRITELLTRSASLKILAMDPCVLSSASDLGSDHRVLQPGTHSAADLSLSCPDGQHSVTVAPGVRVTLYSQEGQRRPQITFLGDQHRAGLNLRGTIASVVVEATPSAAV
ncbi:hypothetical protein ACH4UR_25150 [Streptomyces lydicus]|uniref:hypothetical protein n=1 Tax=Streptomyces lydicus TaxID=47763 RepID=UPI0033EDB5CD